MGEEAGSGALERIVHGLDVDPVFAMSLGSKELFHSNLLDWFISHHPPIAEMLGLPTEVTVQREKDHTDLLIRHGQQPVMLIENKVFALPDTAQLDRLAKLKEAEYSKLILLSLTSPGWPDGTWTSPDGRRWTWLSYRQLGERLQPAVAAVTAADAYAGATLERWLGHFAQLEDLVRAVGRPLPDEALMLPAGQRQILQGARLDAAVQKMRCQQVATGLAIHGIHAHVNLSHGTGLVDWFTGDPEVLRLGWQLQGNQFRLAIVVPGHHLGYGRTGKNRAAREEEAVRHPGFFDFTGLPATYAAAPADGFRHYAPGFVYRYVHVPGITIGEAIQTGAEYGQRIAIASNI
jgi:hypothetical protein